MRIFRLNRIEDETGVSGTGVVAEGIQFTDGTCVLSWLTEVSSIAAIYDSIDTVDQIHGHGGKTVIEWDDLNITIGKLMEISEGIAELTHGQWSNWMKYLFSKGSFGPDGTWTMPAWAVERWDRQMNTPYSELSPEEKDSDRREADKLVEIFTPKRERYTPIAQD